MFFSGNCSNVSEASVLSHELGHNFEFDNAKNAGITSIWSKIARTIYVEACSSFFEYAFINYLIENKIYLEDSLMLRRRYLNQVYYYLRDALTIMNIEDIKVDLMFDTLLESQDVVDYGNNLLIQMNSHSQLYKVGDKINFRNSIVYAMGKLLGIYIYEAYKDNPKEFLSNLKKVLIDYKDNYFKSFEKIGLTYEMVTDGDVLRRVLRDIRR